MIITHGVVEVNEKEVLRQEWKKSWALGKRQGGLHHQVPWDAAMAKTPCPLQPPELPFLIFFQP